MNMDSYDELPVAVKEPSAEEIKRFLECIVFDRLTPGEVDELARVDELKRNYGRSPHEL